MMNDLRREIHGIGRSAYVVRNCVQTAVDVLPIEVVEICEYFHIYTVPVSSFTEFCEFAETEYKKGTKAC